jgi:hypothetical protein
MFVKILEVYHTYSSNFTYGVLYKHKTMIITRVSLVDNLSMPNAVLLVRAVIVKLTRRRERWKGLERNRF